MKEEALGVALQRTRGPVLGLAALTTLFLGVAGLFSAGRPWPRSKH
jgi:hypothetical protein